MIRSQINAINYRLLDKSQNTLKVNTLNTKYDDLSKKISISDRSSQPLLKKYFYTISFNHDKRVNADVHLRSTHREQSNGILA